MGFDLHGIEPTNEKGEYFRNNVWWWRFLWSYMCDMANDILDEKDQVAGGFNDFHVITEDKALAIADKLDLLIKEGEVKKREREFRVWLAEMDDEECTLCEGTGKRKDPPETGAGDSPCNGCSSTGKRRPFVTNYEFDEANVKEFAVFARNSGGFDIG